MPGPTSAHAVVLTALGVEHAAFSAHLIGNARTVHKGTVYEVGRLGADGPTVALAEIGPGNVGAALEAERAIEHFNPHLLLFVGVAGGIKDVQIGDVVAATKLYGYETGKDGAELQSRPDVATVSYTLEQLARAIARERRWLERRIPTPFDSRTAYEAFVGPIAAGEKVVAATASRTYRLIRERLGDTLAVEMEGIGALRAARANAGVHTLVVRGISDLIDEKSTADAAGSQLVASASAAAFAAELLSQYIAAPVSPRARTPPRPTQMSGNGGERDVWREIELVAASLYPQGPLEDGVWSRAGGDVSALDLSGTGRAKWHRAFRTLQNGGGGTSIALLIATMRGDFPDHAELELLEHRVSECK